MFTLNGQTVRYDRPWTHPDTGVQYPANWMRLTSLAEKQAVGLVEVPNPVTPVYDGRFYWNADNPKQLNDEAILDEDGNDTGEVRTGLKTLWKAKQNDIAASLLAPSDWRVIKAQETGGTVATEWTTYRSAVRSACNARQTEIDACADVPALKELLFGDAIVTRAQTDADGNEVVDDDGNTVMETVANPALATAWPAEVA
tara:strand:- start:2054 stop:2653 length:600 start_codon:yes stop_codon:yes gene_type:complete